MATKSKINATRTIRERILRLQCADEMLSALEHSLRWRGEEDENGNFKPYESEKDFVEAYNELFEDVKAFLLGGVV